jgi:hypothetical protein
MTDYSKIPQELKSSPHWLVAEVFPDTQRPGKLAKRPKSAKTGKSIDWNKVENLSSFDDTVAYCAEHPQHVLGFAFEHSVFMALDLDDAIDASGPKEEAMKILQKYREDNAYLERTPSNKGIRLFLKKAGTVDGLPQHSAKQDLGNGASVEVFLGGFCTVTGNHFFGNKIPTADPTEVWRRHVANSRRSITATTSEEGGRNNALISYAGKLAKKGLTAQEIKALVHSENGRFSCPLSESELHSTIYKSIDKYTIPSQDLDPDSWREGCKSFGQLTTELPKFLIGGLIPEGSLTAISAHSFNGKTWFAMQLAKAVSEGQGLWGFPGPESPVPVIYHVPEMHEAQVRHYMAKLQIRDSEAFLVRPMSQGVWPLDDARMLRSSEGRLVVLDTQGFFNPGDDSNDYQQALSFAKLVFNLMNAGCRSVIALFHLAKNSREDWTLQNSIIGSAGYGAMLRSCLRMTNLNPDLNDETMRIYVQGMKNPGLKPFQLLGPPPLRLLSPPGESPVLKDIRSGDPKYAEACSWFESGTPQRQVAKQLNLSLGKVNQMHKRWESETPSEDKDF